EEWFGDQGIHARVDAVEPAGGYARPNTAGAEAGLAQLVETEHTVLVQGEHRQGLVEKRPVRRRYSTSLGHGRDAPRKRVTCLSRWATIRPLFLVYGDAVESQPRRKRERPDRPRPGRPPAPRSQAGLVQGPGARQPAVPPAQAPDRRREPAHRVPGGGVPQ